MTQRNRSEGEPYASNLEQQVPKGRIMEDHADSRNVTRSRSALGQATMGRKILRQEQDQDATITPNATQHGVVQGEVLFSFATFLRPSVICAFVPCARVEVVSYGNNAPGGGRRRTHCERILVRLGVTTFNRVP